MNISLFKTIQILLAVPERKNIFVPDGPQEVQNHLIVGGYVPDGPQEVQNHLIVGGYDAPIDRYNYTVGLFGDTLVANDKRPFCGGTLIAPKWVLSAAHCVIGQTSKVIIGRYDFDDESEDYEEIEVVKTISHPLYKTTTRFDYDYMLIELATESNYLPVKIDDGSLDLEGKTVTAIGWGKEGIFKKQPGNLKMIDMTYVPNCVCQIQMFHLVSITSRMLCGRRVGNAVCFGDSGGPLVVRGNFTTEDVIVGVTSFGVSCSSLWSSVFSRVGTVTSFILEHVGDGIRINENSDDS